RAAHKDTGVKSAFPKNKERDWYSVIVDESFTEQGVYDELDRAAINIIGTEIAATEVEPIPEPAPEEPEETVSLSESLAATKEKGAVGVVSKKSIIEHLGAKFGDKVELNGRANRTPNGKLLMSDNHFAFAPDGKRVCFTYIYEDDDGRITILLRTTAAHAKDIRAAHKDTGVKSAFPKNKERDWYSVIVDESFTEQGVYDELDRAAINIIGTEIAAAEVEPIPEPEPAPEEPTEVLPEEKSLKESLADAKVIGAVGIVTKKSIFNHLADRFGDKVELNGRENRTPNGKLLLSDNHFAFAPDGKRVCFTYVYEDDDGRITILLRTNEEHAKIIRSVHPATGLRSAFPKNKERDWYSMVVDDTFTEKGVYAELDRAALNIIESEPEPAAQEEAPSEEVSLKESLAAAKTVGAVGVVSKKSIIDHLTEKYGDKVEINARENRTPNGKLLLSDNHFALADGKRVCFTYIYEDDGKIVALVRLSDRQAAALHAAHKATGVKSAFPKNKDKDWYSVIVDDTFTDLDVYAVFDESIAYALTK
ncbi:MAG: hypothetical protein IJT69_03975, partial [Clostridia bacterium]|nr:hypothetical protein [Clostridia bacterium]